VRAKMKLLKRIKEWLRRKEVSGDYLANNCQAFGERFLNRLKRSKR
jgi:hypothetical protein